MVSYLKSLIYNIECKCLKVWRLLKCINHNCYCTLTNCVCRCNRDTVNDICNIIGSSTDNLVVNTDEITEILTTLYIGSENSTYICRQFIIFSACFYSYRSCDDSGAQMLICESACSRISQLYSDCVRERVIESLINATNNPEVVEFLEFSLSFDCYKKETYVIEGVEISHSCNEFDFIHDLFPGENNKNVCMNAVNMWGGYCVMLNFIPYIDDSTNDDQPPIIQLTLGILLPLLLICIVVILTVVIVKQYKSKRQLKRRMTTL